MIQRNIITYKIAIMTMSIVLLSSAPAAYASAASMSVSPSSDTKRVGEVFSVDVVIDGKSESFNAAKASVAVSSSLQVENVLLGDCDFSFITTPSITNLSFVGTILGTSSNRCTVYTLNLKPLAVGSGTVTVSNASIKKYGTAAEILQSIQNGTYTINAASNGTTQLPSDQSSIQAAPASETGLVTVAVKVVDGNNNKISGANVMLTAGGQGGVSNRQATTDQTGTAYFKNVAPGVNTVKVENKGKTIEEKILNVSGKEPVMVMGIEAEKEQTTWPYIVGVGVMLVLILVFFFRFFKPTLRNGVKGSE
jgi:VCBS repeat-containing protein